MAKVEIKSKEAKMKAAMSGGKAKRKKWSKGKVREKLQNAVQFDQKVLDKMLVEVAKYKVVTVAVLSEKFKIGGSLARKFIAEQVATGKLRVVSASSNMGVYSRVE